MGHLLGSDDLMGLAGLGESPARHSAGKAASAFLRGHHRKVGCGGRHACAYESTGLKLSAKGEVVARRSAPNTDLVEVCVPGAGKPEARMAAQAIMRGLKAGIGVREVRDSLRVTGRKGRAATAWPGCVTVKVPKAAREQAAAVIASELAKASALHLPERPSRVKMPKKVRKAAARIGKAKRRQAKKAGEAAKKVRRAAARIGKATRKAAK